MLYIRTDANITIATGHIMRCLAIADALREIGEETTFLLADMQVVNLLKNRGYNYIILNSKWDDLESELEDLCRLIEKEKIKKLLIDSYFVTEKYLAALTSLTQIIYLDDLDNFRYPVDCIVCYASYWKKLYHQRNYDKIKLYLGLMYTPLREEFKNCKKKTIKKKIDNLILFSGGTDNYNILNQILEKIEKSKYQKIDVICGNYYTKYEEICEIYSSYSNINIHKNVSNVKEYMEKADFAISAGGTVLYELCAVGTPAISYSIADNQLDNVRQLQEDEIIEYAGDVRTDDVADNIQKCLSKYDMSYELRKEKSAKMQYLVDGKGAARIAEILAKM